MPRGGAQKNAADYEKKLQGGDEDDNFYAKFLNKLGALSENIEIYGVDSNHDAPTTDEYAFRDDVMAYNISALRKKNPDALIVGVFGNGHCTKYMPDAAKPLANKYGVNLYDPAAEQVALLHPKEQVITIGLASKGTSLTQDMELNKIYVNSGQYDQVLRLEPGYRVDRTTMEYIPPRITN